MSTMRAESCACACDEALLRHHERVGVVLQVVPDPGELDVGEVVGLDRALQARVELLDLRHHALRLGLLGGDAWISGR